MELEVLRQWQFPQQKFHSNEISEDGADDFSQWGRSLDYIWWKIRNRWNPRKFFYWCIKYSTAVIEPEWFSDNKNKQAKRKFELKMNNEDYQEICKLIDVFC